jgi:penicillin-binding protein 1A
LRIALEVGIEKIAKIAEQFGVFDSMPRLLSYALGAGESSLLKLTTAYAMLANGGKRIIPTMVEYIQDKRGNVVYKIDERAMTGDWNYDAKLPPKLNDTRQQILSEESIFQLTSLLEGVMQRGSGASASFLNFPMGGKTGTSNESKDTWFIGYTPDVAIGLFVGFDEHSKSLGKNANGTNTALPIFIDFMLEAKKYLTLKPFKVPKGIKLRKINVDAGDVSFENSSNAIVEAFKDDDLEEQDTCAGKNDISALIDEDNTNKNRGKSTLGIY